MKVGDLVRVIGSKKTGIVTEVFICELVFTNIKITLPNGKVNYFCSNELIILSKNFE